MGINNLNKFLRNRCPHVFEEIHLSEYAYKKIAIDISLFLCKFKAIYNDRWISAFINLISCLRRNEIHCVFIYDTSSPPEKAEEKAERVRQREKNEKKVFELEISLEKFYNTGEIDKILTDFNEKIKEKNFKRLLKNISIDNSFDIKSIETKLDKMRSNILSISKDDFDLTKNLFSILNIPYYDAPMEAETSCSDLCLRGLVDGVLSEDTDVLAYGSPVFLTKIDTKTDTCVRIKYNDILDSLEISSDTFLDLCIMCGCDYNKNIPKIGPENSFKYLKKHKSIEEISSNTILDIKILNHIRTRELFREYTKINLNFVPYCGMPNFLLLNEFIEKFNIKIDLTSLKKNCEHTNIIIEEDNEVVIEDNEMKDNNEEMYEIIIED